jgi:hypothetical protein
MSNPFEDVAARMIAVAAERRARMAVLPCAPCLVSSDNARRCELRRAPECKHVIAEERIRDREAPWTARANRLSAAGVDSADPEVLRIVRGELQEWTALRATLAAIQDPAIRWILLWGPPGQGKTIAALAALAELGGLFCGAHDLSLPRPLERSDVLRRARTWTLADAEEARVLVVDDFGLERSTEFAQTQIEATISSREYARQVTILTTNATDPGELLKRYGGRLADRVGGKKGRIFRCAGQASGRARPAVHLTGKSEDAA